MDNVSSPVTSSLKTDSFIAGGKLGKRLFAPDERFRKNFKISLPLACGYFAVALTFGIFAVSRGFSPLVATFISLSNVSSTGQVAGVEIICRSGTYLEILLSVLIVNLRYGLMSLSLSQKLAPMPIWQKLLLAHAVSDEIYVLCMQQDSEINYKDFLGLSLAPVCGWCLGTLVGGMIGDILPAVLVNAMGIGIYGMFIAIIIPPAKQNRIVLAVVTVATLAALAFAYLPYLSRLDFGWRVIIVSTAAAIFGAYLKTGRNSDG